MYSVIMAARESLTYDTPDFQNNQLDFISTYTEYFDKGYYTTFPTERTNTSYANTAVKNEELSLMLVIPVAIVMILLSIITTLGNALVIYAIKSERRLQTVSNYFICSLAVADTMIGVFVMPLSIAYFINNFQWSFRIVLCQMWLSVDYVSCTASIFNLFILSLDRYWSVKSPLKYLRKRTGKRAALMISFVWCFSFSWIIAIVFWHLIFTNGKRTIPPNDCDTEFSDEKYFKMITAIFNFYLPLSFMVILYSRIYQEIRQRAGIEVGNKSTGKKINKQYNEFTLQEQRDAQNGVREGLLNGTKQWTPEFDSGSSSPNSSENSGNQTDSAESTRITDSLRRKPRIDSQLRSISQMAFVTTGLAGFIQYPDGTADDVNNRYLPSQRNHVQTLMQVKEVSCEADGSQTDNATYQEHKETKRMKANIEKVDRNENDIPEMPPKPRLKRKSILRHTNIYSEDVLNRRRSSNNSSLRKISFSLDDSGKNSKYSDVREESEPLRNRHNSLDSSKYSFRRGYRRKESTKMNTRFGLQNGNSKVNDGNSQDNRNSSTGSVLSNFRVSFARFSIKKNQTSEVIRSRMRRFSVHKERKAAKQLGIIIGCFVTCWLPYFISFIIVALNPDLIPGYIHYALIWLGYINSTLNPFIYPMCNGNFRKAFKHILHIGSISRAK